MLPEFPKEHRMDAKKATIAMEERAGKFQSAEDVRETIAVDGAEACRKGALGALAKYWADIKDVTTMLWDYTRGAYREEMPWKTVAALAGAIAYIASPIDAIPDFIPVVGLVDDAAVFSAALAIAGDELARYRKWRYRK